MIYLIRHGQTEWNRQGRKQGQLDSPLTPLGIEQATECGRALAREKLPPDVAMLTSPLGRARATAEIIRNHMRLPEDRVVVDETLAEFDYGLWSGLDTSEIDIRYPGERTRRNRNKWNYAVPGGESYAALASRLQPWLLSRQDGTPLIVVAHDVVSRVLRGLYLKLDTNKILHLTHPQARIYKLAHGKVSQIDAM